MKHAFQGYLIALLLLIVGWIGYRSADIIETVRTHRLMTLLAVAALYLTSHVFRMLRLALLTLDDRKKMMPLATAHALTAFPSSFLPFKIGEIIRLTGFFMVFGKKRRALAIWLIERFGDMLVLAILIIGLQVFHIDVPGYMRTISTLFVIASILGVIALFAIANIFVYLNRHLVLSSHTKRGLSLLRVSHALRMIEIDIHRSIEGRLAGFFLISIVIWSFEIFALSLFSGFFVQSSQDFSRLFSLGLFASLPGGKFAGASVFGLYQSLALIALALCFMTGFWICIRLNLRAK